VPEYSEPAPVGGPISNSSSRLAAISAGLTLAPPLSRSATPEGTALEGESAKKGMEGELVEINLKVNGYPQKLEVDPRVTSQDAIRDRLDLTGAKKGCDRGLPAETPDKENQLEPGELITEIRVPRLPWARRSVYLKIRDRESYEFALASVAVALDVDANNI
jgi:hypothetical protein